jgi:hypothetical protein
LRRAKSQRAAAQTCIVEILGAAEAVGDNAEDRRGVENIAFEAQAFGAAEQIAVFVIDAASRTIHGRIAGGKADQIARAVADLDEDRQISVGVQLVAFADANRADSRDRADRFARIGECLRRIRLTRLKVDE